MGEQGAVNVASANKQANLYGRDSLRPAAPQTAGTNLQESLARITCGAGVSDQGHEEENDETSNLQVDRPTGSLFVSS